MTPKHGSSGGGSGAEHVEHPDGSHSFGVTVDGVFIPFVTLDAVQVADRVAAGKSPEAQAAAGTSGDEG